MTIILIIAQTRGSPGLNHKHRLYPGLLFYELKFPLSFETFRTRIQSLG